MATNGGRKAGDALIGIGWVLAIAGIVSSFLFHGGSAALLGFVGLGIVLIVVGYLQRIAAKK